VTARMGTVSSAREEIALLNPAFVALVLHQATMGFTKTAGWAMPFPHAFIVTPLVLYSSVRTLLPSRIDSSLPVWLQKHPRVALRFPEIAAATVGVTRSGVLLGLRHNVVRIEGDGLEAFVLNYNVKTGAILSSEASEILSRAYYVGRWLAVSGSTETIMALFGVRP
jgi:hypothetical protein